VLKALVPKALVLNSTFYKKNYRVVGMQSIPQRNKSKCGAY